MSRMKFIISGRNINVTEGLRTAVEDKIGKLEKYFTPQLQCYAKFPITCHKQVHPTLNRIQSQ